MNKHVSCNGGCGKFWPDDESTWHHNLGIKVSAGTGEEGSEFKADEPAKLCQECFEKLPEAEKDRWPTF